ncbi:phosphoglycolate phosphatase [Geminicoccaceae bacterium 1502E]|nr:phosphoglycolate phosphatase [Geminicoccaceae bacterium 1502E]
MRRAVVFDLDGTLVETAPDLHRVLAAVLAERGLPAPTLAELRHMVGDGARALIERGFAAAGTALDGDELDRLYARFIDLYVEKPCRDSYAFEGVEEVLTALAADGHSLGVCTNKPQRPSELLLEKLGLARHFASVVGGDALAVRKPHPDHLRAVLETLGAQADRAVMVGDSRNDLATARALGVPCILVSFGYTTVPAHELGAEVVVDRFADVATAVTRLARTA